MPPVDASLHAGLPQLGHGPAISLAISQASVTEDQLVDSSLDRQSTPVDEQSPQSRTMAKTFDLLQTDLENRQLIYSYVFANGNGRNLCAAAPILRREALPMTMCKEEPLRHLTIYIMAYDQKTRDDWLKMEWKTQQNEVFTHVFTTLNHSLVRRLKASVRKIEQLNIIILYLWAKVREVAFLLSDISHWNVDHLMIEMSSEGPQTFNFCTRPLGDLSLNMKCEYNFLSLVHMVLLEPLFSARKMGNTSLSWYCQALPDDDSTPGPMLDLISLPAAPQEDGYPRLRTWNTGKPTNINGFWHELTLNRMRVEVLNITFNFDAALDSFAGNAANRLRLQRFRTWKEGEQCALSLKNWKKTMMSFKQSRQKLQFLKNLRQTSLMLCDPAAFKRSVEAIQDKEWNDALIRRNEAMQLNLLPTSPSTLPATGGKSRALVAMWTRDQMGKLSAKMRELIRSHAVDEWSKQYPLGIPKISYILELQDREHAENHGENANEDKDGKDEESEEED
ncbi:uncharacterized protein PG986_002975 [Apiospora aurea]|uniref:Uncharacterized protein n=1 Tax=Apiospora aurea TaxID=335848 RepID=A0ABR1QQB9_9PEZI